jgi:photosystem II stability/assembly factor-like uncharacterized protein
MHRFSRKTGFLLLTAIAAAGFLLPTASCAVAGDEWEPAGFSAGGLFPCIAIDPVTPGTLFLGSDMSGMYRSRDGGNTWHHCGSDIPSREITGLCINPVRPLEVWAITPMGLFRSRDGGDRWQKVRTDLAAFKHVSYNPISVSPDGRQILVASHRLEGETDGYGNGHFSGSLYRSADGGTSWRLVRRFPDRRLPTVRFDPWDPDTAWLLVSGQGVLRTRDGGRHWSDFSAGLTSRKGLRSIAAAEDRLYLSAVPTRPFTSPKPDPAWRSIRSGIPEAEKGDPLAGPIAAGDAGSVYYGINAWPHVFLRASNPAAGWEGTPVPGGYRYHATATPFQAWIDPWQSPVAIAVEPRDPGRVFITTWYGVMRSADGGRTFEEIVIGTQNTCSTALAASPKGLLAAFMDLGVLFRPAGGTAWQSAFPAESTDFTDLHAWSLEIGIDGTVYAGLSTNRGPRIIASTDGGKSWRMPSQGLPAGGGDDLFQVSLAADRERAEHLYAAVDSLGRKGLFVSVNAGKSWKRITAPSGSREEEETGETRLIKCLEVAPGSPHRLLAGLYWDGLWERRGRAGRWLPIEGFQGKSIQRILCLPEGATLVAADDGLYRQRAPEKEFERISPHLSHLGEHTLEYVTSVAVDPDHSGHLFFATAKNYPVWHNRGSVWFSPDDGLTWQELTAGLPVRNVVELMVCRGRLHAATWGGGVYRFNAELTGKRAP